MCLATESSEESDPVWTADEIKQYNEIDYLPPPLKGSLSGGVSFATFNKLLQAIMTVIRPDTPVDEICVSFINI